MFSQSFSKNSWPSKSFTVTEECPNAESIDFQPFRGLSSGEVSNISPLFPFPSHPIFSCCGSGRGSTSNSQVTASQTQESVVNYYKKSMTYGGVNMDEREYKALRSALASTRMEGFDVTEQTEKDCIRLMNGEVSVADLVKEILARPAKAV